MNSRWPLSIALLLSLVPYNRADDLKPSALGPADVWIVVNKNVPASQALADYYCQKRNVPLDHIILLDLPDAEEISRGDFDVKIRNPLREKLQSLRTKDFILLTTYGVPIRVSGIAPRQEDLNKLEFLRKESAELAKKIQEMEKEAAAPVTPKNAEKLAGTQKIINTLKQAKANHDQNEMILSQKESQAAVDSELALLWWGNYPLARWQVNLRYFTFPAVVRQSRPPIVFTCRIDGPTPAVAKRLIDDALKAESSDVLQGKAYVDARGINWEKAGDIIAGSYGGYDQSLRELAEVFRQAGLTTKLDNYPEVFAKGACPNCALYCGWYALEKYTPALELMPGSIAIHIASFEAVSLRQRTPRRWVPNLLQDGAAVTLGPVSEPYLIAFPKPATFFAFILTGQYTLVECYFLSNHFNSWQMMLIGDPLYRPFEKSPKLKLSDVKQSPEGSQFPPKG